MWDIIKDLLGNNDGEIVTLVCTAVTAWIIRMIEKRKMKRNADGNQ